MVERIMLFKLVASGQRDEVATFTQQSLSRLRDLEELSVGVPADAASSDSWDVSVVMGFATEDELTRALESPQFRDYVMHGMAGRYEVLKAWSFKRVE